MEPPKPQVASLPAADVTAPASTPESVVHRAYPVRQPEEEHAEFMVPVRASTLTRVRRRAKNLAQAKFPWPELLLGVSTAALGAALGAIPADVDINKPLGLLYFVAFPVVCAGTSVAYFMLRKNSILDASKAANELLEDLPDPEKAR
jgi:hypothetical protein